MFLDLSIEDFERKTTTTSRLGGRGSARAAVAGRALRDYEDDAVTDGHGGSVTCRVAR
jgi:hypothetical protein